MMAVVFAILGCLILSRSTRAACIPGGVCDTEESLTEIQAFIEDELNKFVGEGDNLLKITDVFRKQTQVVAGIKYILELEISETHCVKDSSRGTPQYCHPKRRGSTQRCVIEVWEKTWEGFREIIRKDCTDTTGLCRNFGSIFETDEPLTEVINYVERELNDDVEEGDGLLKITDVRRKRKQVVAGTKYYLELEVSETDCDKSETTFALTSSCLPRVNGAIQICNIEVLEQPQIAASEYWDITDKECVPQVVAGTKYIVKLLFVETDCVKGAFSNSPLAYCKTDNKKPFRICDVEVWDKPWEDFRKIIKNECFEQNFKDTGALYDTEKPLTNILKFVEAEFNKDVAEGENLLKVTNVVSKQAQVVSGLKHVLTLEFKETNCVKDSFEISMSSCEADADAKTKTCDVEVLEKAWENFQEITKKACIDGKKNMKTDEEVIPDKEDKKPKYEFLHDDFPPERKRFVEDYFNEGKKAGDRLLKIADVTFFKSWGTGFQGIDTEYVQMKVTLRETNCLKKADDSAVETDCTTVPSASGYAQVCELKFSEDLENNQMRMDEVSCVL
ncbi:unnamed protein product [Cyprideis torosa]|uniref:Uncharacterized protein n=1 Tax=Cyprideis torosa TaxID=163714 RepID=A0A7R8W3E5_9CRUS|nr:unnamed protein product [Cyprideis torosa]CAG0882036.1 unnamed protein product [Cyprideis torosa]